MRKWLWAALVAVSVGGCTGTTGAGSGSTNTGGTSGSTGTDSSTSTGTGSTGDTGSTGATTQGSTGGTGSTGSTGGTTGTVGTTGVTCPSGSSAGSSTGGTGAFDLRVMAANLSSGNRQSYDPGEGIRIIQGLHPDVVLIQEFNYKTNSSADLGEMACQLGMAAYQRGASGQQIPNGILSKYPILEGGDWVDPKVGNRAFTWAHIDLPGSKDLYAISLHLLTSNASDRDAEASALVAFIRQNIPSDAYLVLGGDFNTGSRTEACAQTLGGVVKSSVPAPTDQSNNPGTNASRSKPYDWVLANTALNSLEQPLVIGATSKANGLVFDSRVYTPLTDVAPVQAGDSGASNMQHMGVVRQFHVTP